MTPRMPRSRLVGSFALTALVLAACGGTDPDDGSDGGGIDAAIPEGAGFTPMPLLSRGQPVAGVGAELARAVDGDYHPFFTWTAPVTAAAPAWIAIDLGARGAGVTQAMVTWTRSVADWDASSEAIAVDYTLATSATSTDGRNGTWTEVARVAGNTFGRRAHKVPFTGQRWVRLEVTAAVGATVELDEIDVHDATAGARDTWIFLGDSITAMSVNRSHPSIGDHVHMAAPAYDPMMLPAGIGGTSAQSARAHLDAWLDGFPDVQHWTLAYGTNDSASGDPQFAALYETNLRALIETLRARGKTPIVPRIPYKVVADPARDVVPAYNAVVDRLVAEYGLVPGPDLYTWFKAHPEQLPDTVHPDEDGAAALRRLWADAVLPLYPR